MCVNKHQKRWQLGCFHLKYMWKLTPKEVTAGLFPLNKYVCKLTPEEVAAGLFSLNNMCKLIPKEVAAGLFSL